MPGQPISGAARVISAFALPSLSHCLHRGLPAPSIEYASTSQARAISELFLRAKTLLPQVSPAPHPTNAAVNAAKVSLSPSKLRMSVQGQEQVRACRQPR